MFSSFPAKKIPTIFQQLSSNSLTNPIPSHSSGSLHRTKLFPLKVNFIAVTSPAYEGAFRFEAAYRKGRAEMVDGGWWWGWTLKLDKLWTRYRLDWDMLGSWEGPKLAHTSLEVGVIATTYNSTYFGNWNNSSYTTLYPFIRAILEDFLKTWLYDA